MNIHLPTARETDPQTSHDAAASVVQLTAKRAAVLRVFQQDAEGMTDWEMTRVYEYLQADSPQDYPQQSVSGMRTRRSELVKLGRLTDSGQRSKMPSGRLAVVWKLVP